MFLVELFKKIEEFENRSITQAEFARVLGSLAPSINKRVKTQSEVMVSELVKLQKHYGFSVASFLSDEAMPDSIEIKYWQIPNQCNNKIKNPLITSVWLDRELIVNIWKKNPDNLKTIRMIGDRMNGGEYPLKHDDILIVDTFEKEIVNSGIYLFTAQNDSNIFINGVRKNIDGSITFFFTNKAYEETTYTLDELNDFGFKPTGRIIKNMSLIL